jgi:hypothetical protein
MSFRITGLPLEPFAPLFGLADADLARHGALRYVADSQPGFPCRITLEDAAPGERVLLLPYLHQPADTPYRASHAIFVRESAARNASFVDEVPPVLAVRTISLRAFDRAGMMLDADLAEGSELQPRIEHLLAGSQTSYLQAHYAKRGCYAARIERV